VDAVTRTDVDEVDQADEPFDAEVPETEMDVFVSIKVGAGPKHQCVITNAWNQ
jgi:hypothetical protein